MSRFTIFVLVALFTLCAAVPSMEMMSPALQKRVRLLKARRRALQNEISEADENLKGLTRDRRVAQVDLQTLTRKVSLLSKECHEIGNCDYLSSLKEAFVQKKEKLDSINEAISDAMDPKMLEQRRIQLIAVTDELGVMSKVLAPGPSVAARPIRE